MKFLHIKVNEIDAENSIKLCQNELEIKKIWIGKNIDLSILMDNLYERNDQG